MEIGGLSRAIHGTNAINLVEKIVRTRVFESTYWRQYCFALNAENLVDRAAALEFMGGVCSENNKPTPFLCLLVKMLQLQPEFEIVHMFIENEEFKYLRALGAVYLRLTGKPADIYRELEPLYADYRKLAFQKRNGWDLLCMDELVDELLTSDISCDIALPRLVARNVLEASNMLASRESLLHQELAQDSDEDSLGELPPFDLDGHVDSVGPKEPEKKQDYDEMKEERGEKRKKKHKKEKEQKKKKKSKKEKKKMFIKGLKGGALSHAENGTNKKSVVDDIEEQNKVRASLGLAPLRP
mmetsp:Transcript_1201/g.1430  ORF Transcript_1201/g.1430 Transcript_1201/m.1430 type:complete len:298 (-) Transcript_1201:1954-2847(-)